MCSVTNAMGTISNFFSPARASFSMVSVSEGDSHFAPSHLALVAKRVRVFPPATLHHQTRGLFHVLGVRIPTLDQAERQSVRAENDVRAIGIVKVRESQSNFFDDGLDVQRMVEKLFDHVRARGVPVRAI